jgi:thermostable 8-oxoguanine DNA glycosylase
VWLRYADRFARLQPAQVADEEKLRFEMTFCLLGGHSVSYEHAASTARQIQARRVEHDVRGAEHAVRELARFLAEPHFLPRRRDGSLRRYRFPERKARLLVAAEIWVRENGGLATSLGRDRTEAGHRSWLCRCPGFGMKTASWFLRNTGWASTLAILDIHVIRALQELGLVREVRLPKDYVEVEHRYLAWCDDLAVSPASMDLFLWELQRSRVAPGVL